jgi:predicted  nucleic acid-binding Zn-ribbon protein
MKTVVANLFELQKIEILSTTESSPKSDRLREQIPAEMIDAYERSRIRGRKVVALVRNGVCGECHLRIPMGTLVHLMHGELQRCGNCGRYLYLPEDAPVTVSVSSSAPRSDEPSAPRKRRKKVEQTAQAA